MSTTVVETSRLSGAAMEWNRGKRRSAYYILHSITQSLDYSMHKDHEERSQ